MKTGPLYQTYAGARSTPARHDRAKIILETYLQYSDAVFQPGYRFFIQGPLHYQSPRPRQGSPLSDGKRQPRNPLPDKGLELKSRLAVKMLPYRGNPLLRLLFNTHLVREDHFYFGVVVGIV